MQHEAGFFERNYGLEDRDHFQTIYDNLAAQPEVRPLPELNEDEQSWLYCVSQGDDNWQDYILILETDTWVRKIRDLRDYLGLYHTVIEQLVIELHTSASSSSDVFIYRGESNSKVGIAYCYRQDCRQLLLLEPLKLGDNEQAIINNHTSYLQRLGDAPDDLLRVATRSYPSIVVVDENAWFAIQKNEEANLALSPEEADLLNQIRNNYGGNDDLSYPLFINGRAGSGKSTMLQYIAAEYINFKLRSDTALAPLYMTCSKPLLDRARNAVKEILTAHYSRLINGTHDQNSITRILDDTFKVFHDYLYSLLNSEEKRKFLSEKYVTYSTFCQLWKTSFSNRPESRQISPDIAWHTIRTYIKGMRLTEEDELDPDEFEQLPENRRSVSLDTFKLVFEQVWERWYKPKCRDEGYWDDQDLAACILDSDVPRSLNYAAVFCDEAQDFTHLELELIFQLSVYAKRRLTPEQLKRVPIVFAGDPLQTINPTGFYWEAVKADFYDRFQAILDPFRYANSYFSFIEMRYNYRSNPGIVKFTNLILLIRASLLKNGSVTPQKGWWIEEATQPVWFSVDDSTIRRRIKHRPDLVIILNCEGVEECKYVASDEILRGLERDFDGEVYRNIFSSIRAKGLEFSSVVLYRFAEKAPRELLELINGNFDLNMENEKLIPIQYFLNRLYVAASRAKGQLVIVDTDEAIEKFWKFAMDPDIVRMLSQKIEKYKDWSSEELFAYLVKGREEVWEGERIDPLKQGEEYAKQGKINRDPYLMRQAALAYKCANDQVNAEECYALAAEFEGKLDEAGGHYEKINNFDKAFNCYWQGQHFDRICQLASKDQRFAASLKSRAADFATKRGSGLNPHFLNEVIKAAEDINWVKDAMEDITWQKILSTLVEKLAVSRGDLDISWEKIFNVINTFIEHGLEIPQLPLASIAYNAGRYEVAIQIWNQNGVQDRDKYAKAMAQVESFPKNLKYLSELRQWNEILRQWEKNRSSVPDIGSLDDTITSIIFDAAIAERDLSLALELLEKKPERKGLEALLAEAAKRNDKEMIRKGANLAVCFFVKSGAWPALIHAVENADFQDLARGLNNDALTFLKSEEVRGQLLKVAVEKLAFSQELINESADRKNQISEFLHRNFISQRNSAKKYDIPQEIVGAAIERAGKIIDALQYYDNLLQEPTAPESLRKFAAERLIRNYERHAAYFRERGEERVAREKESKANEIRERERIGTIQISDYPDITARSEPQQMPAWHGGPFEFQFLPKEARLRFAHIDRQEAVSVFMNEMTIRGELNSDIILNNAPADVAWRLPSWGATIRMRKRDNSISISCMYPGGSLEISVRNNQTA
ncbi:MAG: ATP-binding domain-containing protein [Rectinema sp.]|nr:ATP-binding domain-containing protein [Rectinema sp.]